MPSIDMQRGFINELMALWDSSRSSFYIHGKDLRPSGHDFSIILFLRNEGSQVDVGIKRKPQVKSKIWTKFFKSNCQISRDEMEETLVFELESNERKASPKEWLSLLTMYLFQTVLFPQSNSACPVQLWETVDDVDDLWEYAWGSAVFDYVNRQLAEIGFRARNRIEASPYMNGCSFALLVWFYEHTWPMEYEVNPKTIPRYCNWILKSDCQRQTFRNLLGKLIPKMTVKQAIPAEQHERWVTWRDTEHVKLAYREALSPNPKVINRDMTGQNERQDEEETTPVRTRPTSSARVKTPPSKRMNVRSPAMQARQVKTEEVNSLVNQIIGPDDGVIDCEAYSPAPKSKNFRWEEFDVKSIPKGISRRGVPFRPEADFPPETGYEGQDQTESDELVQPAQADNKVEYYEDLVQETQPDREEYFSPPEVEADRGRAFHSFITASYFKDSFNIQS